MFQQAPEGGPWTRIVRTNGASRPCADFVEVAPCGRCGQEIDREFDRARYKVREGQVFCRPCLAPTQLTLVAAPPANTAPWEPKRHPTR